MVRNWNDCVDMTKVGSDDEEKYKQWFRRESKWGKNETSGEKELWKTAVQSTPKSAVQAVIIGWHCVRWTQWSWERWMANGLDWLVFCEWQPLKSGIALIYKNTHTSEHTPFTVWTTTTKKNCHTGIQQFLSFAFNARDDSQKLES